ncbi:MAG: PIN domain-containing protein [Gammaproteobacteria bacterium]|nr:PIN domain-containing protein [Gammaproteobacteria bacterium]
MAAFLDSNIVLYALSDDKAKKAPALALLAANPHISIQVINECSHVLRRRLNWPPAKVAKELSVIIELVQLENVEIEQTRLAWTVAERYGFSHYDSLIIATALTTGCDTLYTEDMQHGQVINDCLTLINPFLDTLPEQV